MKIAFCLIITLFAIGCETARTPVPNQFQDPVDQYFWLQQFENIG